VVCRSVGLSVGLSVTVVSPVKTAEPIEMPFGLRTRVGLGNHVLEGSPEVLRNVWDAVCYNWLCVNDSD